MAARALLGLGGCVDYELTLSAPVLERLAADYAVGAAELTSPAPVVSERDLVVSILRYVARGGGGEHFAASAEALETFAARFPHRTTLGGTSVRAGLAMARLGIPSTLHLVSVNDTVRRLLPPAISYVSSGRADTLHPHLIVQWDQGLRIGSLGLTAPAPNRLIYVNDPDNESMALSDDLGALLADASVLLLSNFNAMRDQDLLDRRLATLREHLRRLPPSAVTYFEDAAYHEPAFSRRVRDALLPHIDVYGLNEDELQSYLGRPVDLLSPADVAAALRSVHALIPAPTLVLHTRYWALSFGVDHAGALDNGIVLAATRYVHGDDFTDADVTALRRRPRRSADFADALRAEMGERVRCAPGFELDIENPTTVGLGDTFVGGFLAEVANPESIRPPTRHPQAD
jgi:ADP-dependent phosphofructokinase/glucokinase